MGKTEKIIIWTLVIGFLLFLLGYYFLYQKIKNKNNLPPVNVNQVNPNVSPANPNGNPINTGEIIQFYV